MLTLMSTYAHSQSTSFLRTDGVYQSKKVNNSYYYYLRFYADSTMISISSTGKVKDLAKWFNKDYEDISTGNYSMKNDSIFFESSSKVGTVVYRGALSKKQLNVHSESLINGHISERSFKFRKIAAFAFHK